MPSDSGAAWRRHERRWWRTNERGRAGPRDPAGLDHGRPGLAGRALGQTSRASRTSSRARASSSRAPEMEVDRAWKQVIPYLVLRDGARYFLMRRTRAGGDARLHDRFSIGVGGHLNPGDGDLAGGLRREWREELEADFEPEFELIGLLNDDTTEVGSVHLGAVYVADAGGLPVAIRETDKLSGRFADTRRGGGGRRSDGDLERARVRASRVAPRSVARRLGPAAVRYSPEVVTTVSTRGRQTGAAGERSAAPAPDRADGARRAAAGRGARGAGPRSSSCRRRASSTTGMAKYLADSIAQASERAAGGRHQAQHPGRRARRDATTSSARSSRPVIPVIVWVAPAGGRRPAPARSSPSPEPRR